MGSNRKWESDIFLTYLKELKNDNEKKLHKKEDFTRMCLEIQIKTHLFLRYFIK